MQSKTIAILKLLELLMRRRHISSRVLARELGITPHQAGYILARLRWLGLVSPRSHSYRGITIYRVRLKKAVWARKQASRTL